MTSCLASPLCSVCYNGITGFAAKTLANVVLDHATLTTFNDIPLTSLRDNSIEELNLRSKGIGIPGAIVLSKLLLSNSSLKSAKCVDQSCPHCSASPLAPRLCAVNHSHRQGPLTGLHTRMTRLHTTTKRSHFTYSDCCVYRRAPPFAVYSTMTSTQLPRKR